MLYIKGANLFEQETMENMLLFPASVFNHRVDDRWLDSDFGRQIITDIDRVNVMDTSVPTRRLLLDVGLRPDDLATGTKNLFLCRFFSSQFDEPLYNRMGHMGENCFKWLVKAARDVDIHMVTTLFRKFKDSDLELGDEVYFEDLHRSAKTGYDVTSLMLDLSADGYFLEPEER